MADTPSTYVPPDEAHCVLVEFYGDNVIQPWCKTAVVTVPSCHGLHVNVHGNFPRYCPDTDSFDIPLDAYHDKAVEETY